MFPENHQTSVQVNPSKKKNIRVRGIALPNEHGSWGFMLEPLVAAVAIAPTLPSLSVTILIIGAFLTRQPVKIRLTNWLQSRDLPHNRIATKFIAAYGLLFVIGLIGCLYFIPIENLWPFFFFVPFGIYQIYCDVLRKSRELLPEVTGAIAISSSAAVIALAAGWKTAAATAFWGILAARFIPSILYVRNRLLLEKGKAFSFYPVIAAHITAAVVVGILAVYGLSSWLVFGLFLVLLARALHGLSRFRRKQKAMMIGIWEVIFGLLTVLAIVIGHYFQNLG